MGPLVRTDGTRVSIMARHSCTTRVLLALYMSFGLPLCCCHQSAAATTCCVPTDEPEAMVSQVVDAHVHDNHSHDYAPQHQHGDQAPVDDHAPDPTIPCDHDDSCNCGGAETRSLLLEKSVTIDYSVFEVAAVSWISPITTVHRLSVRPFAIGITMPLTSLVRLHCALII